MKYLYTLLSLFFIGVVSVAQPSGDKVLYVKKAVDQIKLDGIIDEQTWTEAQVTGDFHQVFPFDSSMAIAKTEVMMAYDENFLYAVGKMYDTIPGKNIITSLRRDFQGPEIDGFHLTLDTFADNINAFNFALNPYGVQREGLIVNGGNASIDVSWDNKWYSSVKVHDGFWVAEFAIPLKTLRYKEGSDHWRINFMRIDNKHNERSAWAPIPRGFRLSSLAFSGDLYFDKPLKKPGTNVSIIPYVAGSSLSDYETGDTGNYDVSVGGDAKIAVTPSLNLDLTFNPDFSQVEVDRQQTNLSRFELFFPERRQFFLENADLFGNFGGRNTRPFFSRRIGIAEDTTSGTNVQNRINFGMRLSGKIDNNWRIGLLNMQTDAVEESGIPETNYGMAVIQRKIGGNSDISAFWVNKQALFYNREKAYAEDPSNFNRVFGLEGNLRSKDGKWRTSGFYHQSFDESEKDENYAFGGSLNYQTPEWELFSLVRGVGAGYNAEVGFVPRTDFMRYAGNFSRNFYPRSKLINRHGPTVDTDITWNDTYGKTDHDVNLIYEVALQNQSSFRIQGRYDYTYLFDPFDPTNTDGAELAADTEFEYYSFRWRYASNNRKLFFIEFNGQVGEYFNGRINRINGSLNYRIQPVAILSLDYDLSKIDLPEPYNDADLILVGPRFDFTFSRSLFFTTLLQYNNQIDNINLNARLQWRFKPVSDFFLVYTDNYFAENPRFMNTKNRAIVFKLTYWLNL